MSATNKQRPHPQTRGERLDPTGETMVPDTPGHDWWPFELMMIPIGQIKVERFDGKRGFQRQIRSRFVERAVKGFDPIRFEPLTVCRPAEDPAAEWFSDLDGQHRLEIANELGFAVVPCCCYIGRLDYATRAVEFYKLNRDRQQVNLHDGVRALVEGEDSETLAMLAVLKVNGFYLFGHRPDDANGHKPLHALGSLQRNFSYDRSATERAISLLSEWHDVLTRSAEGKVIDALCSLLRHEGVDQDRLRRILRNNGPQHIEMRAKEYAATKHRGLNAEAVEHVLTDLYDKGLRTNRIGRKDV